VEGHGRGQEPFAELEGSPGSWDHTRGSSKYGELSKEWVCLLLSLSRLVSRKVMLFTVLQGPGQSKCLDLETN
jgi:hypothetical protein